MIPLETTAVAILQKNSPEMAASIEKLMRIARLAGRHEAIIEVARMCMAIATKEEEQE